VLDALGSRTVSLAARLLALVLAHKARRTSSGRHVIWRGRNSLARLTGLSTKSVTKARQELLRLGLFCHVVGVQQVQAANGKTYSVARGVKVLELVRDIPAFVRAREASRERATRQVEVLTHYDRLQIQKRSLRGEISDPERIDRENAIRLEAESQRRVRCRQERSSP
jgi:hypothetical protein